MASPLRPDHVLALQAALLEGDRAVEAFRAWRRLVDFDAIDPPTTRIAALMLANVGDAAAGDPVLGRMKGLYRRTWTLNTMRLGEAEKAIGLLERAGIPTLLLKGGAIVVRWIGDAGLREMSDVDVLVPRDRALEALAALRTAGWMGVSQDLAELRDPDFDDEHGALVRSPAGVELDLHWRVLRHGRRDEGVWTRSEVVRLGERETRVLAAEDQLVHTCAHAATWEAQGRIDWAADAALVIRDAGRIDWERVIDTAREQRLEIPIARLLRALRDQLELEVPAAVPRRLLRTRPALLDRLEFRLRGRPPHELAPPARALVELQDHRRRTRDLIFRPPAHGAMSLARERWVVAGRAAVLRHAAFRALGSPALLRRMALGGSRAQELTRRSLVGVADSPLALGVGGRPRESLLTGWSFPEPGGRWTDGEEAVLAVALAGRGQGDLPVRVTLLSCIAPEHPAVKVDVFANDRRAGTWTFAFGDGSPGWRAVVIPAQAMAGRDTLELAFRVSDPFVPAAAGQSADPRRLGLFVREILLGPPDESPTRASR